MSKNKIVFFIGVVLLIMPFLGFPPSWKSFISIVFGITLVVLSFSAAAKRRASARRTRRIRQQGVSIETSSQPSANVTILSEIPKDETGTDESVAENIRPTI